MSSFIIFTCILSALTSADSSLLCLQCTAADEHSCVGVEKKCPSHDYLCAATKTFTIMEGKVFTNFTRSCERRSSCGITGSIGYQKGKIKTVISCCEVESCTPATPSLPTENLQKNGLTCRSCTSMDYTWCYTDDTIACTGEENRCILKTTKTTGTKYGKTAVRGCATKTLCDVGYQYHDFAGLKITTEVTCTSGCSSFHHSLVLLALGAFTSVKLLF